MGVVFVLVAGAVFLVGWLADGPRDSEPTRATATATVEVELEEGQGQADSLVGVLGEAPWLWIDGIRQQVTS